MAKCMAPLVNSDDDSDSSDSQADLTNVVVRNGSAPAAPSIAASSSEDIMGRHLMEKKRKEEAREQALYDIAAKEATIFEQGGSDDKASEESGAKHKTQSLAVKRITLRTKVSSEFLAQKGVYDMKVLDGQSILQGLTQTLEQVGDEASSQAASVKDISEEIEKHKKEAAAKLKVLEDKVPTVVKAHGEGGSLRGVPALRT